MNGSYGHGGIQYSFFGWCLNHLINFRRPHCNKQTNKKIKNPNTKEKQVPEFTFFFLNFISD